MTRRNRATLIGLLALLQAWAARAADPGSPRLSPFDVSFNAFGTAGIVHSDESQADFVTNARQPAGPGFTRAWSLTPDSKLGAQLTGTFADRLSAVIQVVSQYQANGSYSPRVEWANLKYQLGPDADIRVGRIALPTYLYSDSLNVGYALPYMRIPLEVFGELPITNSDGVDGSYRFHWGSITTTVQAFLGHFNSSVPGGYYDAHELRGLTATLERGPLTVHVSYQTLRYDFAFGGVVLVAQDPQSVAAFGVSYDPGRWFFCGEVIRSPDAAEGLSYGGYVLGGYRIGAFTPYVGYARINATSAGYLPIPPIIDQRTNTLGLRWDVARHVDLKLQWDRTVLHGGINAYFANQQPGFNPFDTVNLIGLAVDFVW